MVVLIAFEKQVVYQSNVLFFVKRSLILTFVDDKVGMYVLPSPCPTRQDLSVDLGKFEPLLWKRDQTVTFIQIKSLITIFCACAVRSHIDTVCNLS